MFCKKQIVRNFIRNIRHKLTFEEQKISAEKIIKFILFHPKIIKSKNIALYLSFDGEINTRPLINELLKNGKNIFLPVINQLIPHHLDFLYFDSKTKLIKNIFNIDEPKLNKCKILPIKYLDIIIVPLVAFDNKCNRLGMGGGFYDKILQNWSKKNFYPIGLAHNCQYVKKLFLTELDVQLPEIITPEKIWKKQ
ncbi:5-formyltetrahydrofolate cyclo-ligase [Candidatus Providencia siddallii]|uniref:5-formyltetrahydrofolate cyclo-ligase n=1 Tax=Candidatus Providencia siddallii TaxID=1715285 RepID=A0ABM9NP10_9GAMM